MKKLIGAVVILALVALGAWYVLGQRDESLVSEKDAVLVEDQQPGDTTIVTYAKLSQTGYVAVYATDASGNTTLLGTSDLLAAGEHRNVPVRHSTGAAHSGTITGRVIADDGDGTFNEGADTAVLAEDSGEASADAELDLGVSDEDLAELLEGAGYDASVETSQEDAGSAAGIVEEGTPTEGSGAADEGVDMEADSSVDTEVEAVVN